MHRPSTRPTSPRHRAGPAALLLAACLAGPLWAADAPLKEEWEPVRSAVAAGAPDAEAQLTAFIARFPRWPGGYRELARINWDQGKAADCLANAQQALTFDKGDAQAAALAIQSLLALQRGAEAYAIADTFTKADKEARSAWVNFHAADVAFALGDVPRADTYLKRAVNLAGRAAPAEFSFLDGRLALRRQPPDLARAEASFARATDADPRLWDAWYELGRVASALAEEVPTRRAEFLDKAAASFSKVVKTLPDDHESWLGLGRVQLEQGKQLIERGEDGPGGRMLREAESSLREALRGNPTSASGSLSLGETLVRQEKYEDAIAPLRKAQELGSTDRSLDYNLAMALEKSGRAAEATEVLSRTVAATVDELIAKGMSFHKAGSCAQAVNFLEKAAASPELAADPARRARVLCFLGHAFIAWAAKDEGAVREGRLDQAAAGYRESGDLGDRIAQRHFLALQAQRDPRIAYQGGLTFLRWNRWLAPKGWGVVIANYGASRAWTSFGHQIAWGLAFCLPLMLWIASWIRARRMAADLRRLRASRTGTSSGPRTSSESNRPVGDAPARTASDAGRSASRAASRDAASESQNLSPLTQRVRDKDALERKPPAATPAATAKRREHRTPLPGDPKPVPKRKTPLPETEQIELPEPPADQPRPRPRRT